VADHCTACGFDRKDYGALESEGVVMAKTIAIATGYDATRQKETQRLGSNAATARANTWHTFTTCHVDADGSGYVLVKRGTETLHRFEFGPEETT
jgi:hypothetical protein